MVFDEVDSGIGGAVAEIVGQKLRVHYTLDASGHLRDVWVLTPDEARREPWPKTQAEAERWFFDWSAQAWTKR